MYITALMFILFAFSSADSDNLQGEETDADGMAQRSSAFGKEFEDFKKAHIPGDLQSRMDTTMIVVIVVFSVVIGILLLICCCCGIGFLIMACVHGRRTRAQPALPTTNPQLQHPSSVVSSPGLRAQLVKESDPVRSSSSGRRQQSVHVPMDSSAAYPVQPAPAPGTPAPVPPPEEGLPCLHTFDETR